MKETLMFASITISETIQPSWLLMQSSVFLCQFSRRCINNVPCDVNEVKITISTECFRPIHSICKCFAALIVALFDRKCTAKQLKDVLQTISLLVPSHNLSSIIRPLSQHHHLPTWLPRRLDKRSLQTQFLFSNISWGQLFLGKFSRKSN